MSVETYVSASTLPLRFVVTVDTEADDAWAHPDEIRLDNIRALPRFQELCERFSVVPTYLLTYECAHRDEALSILAPIADSARCEIGHHLHVWTCPPFAIGDRDVDRRFVLAHQFMLPDALFVQKAERLRQEIEMSFGRSPTSHRAGRWGIDQRSVDWLCGAGFVAETSLRPSVRLPPSLGHHASTRYTLHRNPFLWASTDGDTGLVELPVTVDFPQGAAARACRAWLASGLPFDSAVARVYRKLGGQRQLRPNPRYRPGELSGIVDAAIRQGVRVLNLMLHSSELALGCSPLSRNEDDARRVWLQLAEVFAHVQRAGIRSAALTATARLVRPPIGDETGHGVPMESSTSGSDALVRTACELGDALAPSGRAPNRLTP